ncbi:Acg family FMN-binding oxidoreductase [Nocardia sp. 004]|uniref:Acg family FMN-binding oxidoreductase n=1 Tax=Nocardia sp. 004 TaxID=3385978 RepID=UPI0039A010C4
MTADDEKGAVPVPDHPTMLAALQLATRAPSVHNTQPWRWVFDGVRLHLYTDTDRLLSATDPLGRQLVISCGAMLHHARTAFADRGWHTDTTRVPDLDRPDRLAVIAFRTWPDPPAGIHSRALAIDQRHTDRLPLSEPEGFADLLPRIRMLASPHEVELDVLDDNARARLTSASEQTKAARREDLFYQTELQWWTGRSENSVAAEGVPQSTLVSDAEFARVGVGRAYPPSPHSMRRAQLEDRARLLVLSTGADSVLHWLRAGEALSAVLLECTAVGLATCAFTHITELEASRELLTNLLPQPSKPQVVIRAGTAPADADPIPATPRRGLSDIFTIVESH